jgi:penicillin-binding protein 1A
VTHKTKPKRGFKKRLILALFIAAAGVCLVYGTWAEFYDLSKVEDIPERSAVFDMDGKFYSRLRGENRVVVPLEKISPHFVKALLAREDTRFYGHHGVDPWGILRATVRNLLHGKLREGGSTLTQQLALNSFLGGKHTRSLNRKLLEAALALRIERNFSKRKILECYINRIYFGAGYFGAETASQAYFGKSAAQLNLSESAMLVGLIRSPNRFSPFRNLEAAYTQRDMVINRMADLKMITPVQAGAALESRVSIPKKRTPTLQQNYAMEAVLSDLDLLIGDDQIQEGGLRVYTTLDPQLQKAAMAAVDSQLRKVEERSGYPHPKRADYSKEENSDTPYLQGALMAIDNRTGGIRAVVGGRDYSESTFNRAFLARRQIGSTFKPFVYAAAFGRGLSPDAEIDDGPIRIGNWSPSNSDGTFRSPMPAREGLVQSRNTMSVRVGSYAGLAEVQRVAAAAGLNNVPRVPSAYLGAFETTLKELTSAYTVFPNGGLRRQPYLIERIDDSDGHVLYRAAHLSVPALDEYAVSLLNPILAQVLERGTAAAARSMGFNKPAAGKTGTTNDFRDAWFVGYTRSLTCGVWVGMDRPQTIVSHGYGSALALPIWVDLMNAAPPQRYPASAFESRSGGPRPNRESLPENLFRSFRKIFGGD